jgi:hypothetical protein
MVITFLLSRDGKNFVNHRATLASSFFTAEVSLYKWHYSHVKWFILMSVTIHA